MELVAEARIKAVVLWRTGKPGWDRPDSASDPWYKEEEWDDQGNYYGPVKKMLPKPVNKETDSNEVGVPDSEDPDSEDPDSSQTDSAKEIATVMLKEGHTFRAITIATGLKTGAIQRLKAKISISD